MVTPALTNGDAAPRQAQAPVRIAIGHGGKAQKIGQKNQARSLVRPDIDGASLRIAFGSYRSPRRPCRLFPSGAERVAGGAGARMSRARNRLAGQNLGRYYPAVPTINLADDEFAATAAAIRRAIKDDRFPHAPRLDPLPAALGKFEAAPELTPPPEAPPPAKVDKRARR